MVHRDLATRKEDFNYRMSGAYFPCRMSILTAVYLNTDHRFSIAN